jgi:hypothetical protein
LQRFYSHSQKPFLCRTPCKCSEFEHDTEKDSLAVILTFILTLLFSPAMNFIDILILSVEVKVGAGEGNRTLVSGFVVLFAHIANR